MGTRSLSLYKADLHVHTCLSPCGDWRMRPRQIVEKSLARGLDMIAVCDHNSAENAGAVQRFGEEKGLVVFPGLEICSREEVHILSIFGKLEQALTMQSIVYANLPGTNRADVFGDQMIVDDHDVIMGQSPRMLINATRLNLYDIVESIHLLKGLSIASHIFRPAYGILRQIGFIPVDLRLDAVEVSNDESTARDPGKPDLSRGLPQIRSSDAHALDRIGRAWTAFTMAGPTLAEIRLALKRTSGRRMEI